MSDDVAAPVAPAESESAQKPEDQATSTAEAGQDTAAPAENDTATPEQAAKKGQARLERKLNRLYRERAEAVARADLLQAQLQSRPVEQPKGRPKFEDFNYDPEKFATAIAEFERGNAITEYESKRQKDAQDAQQKALSESWRTKVERGDTKYDDFDSVVGDLKPVKPWSAAIIQAENGEDVAYFLGKNTKEAQRIDALDPLSQILEIGRISATLAAAPAQKPNISKAPKPIDPLQGTTGGAKGEPDPNDTEKWVKWRQKQVHGR